MYSKGKYLVVKIANSDHAIVFDESVKFSDVGNLFRSPPTSGGFFHYTGKGVVVYGESTNCKVKALPSDAVLIGRAISHPSTLV